MYICIYLSLSRFFPYFSGYIPNSSNQGLFARVDIAIDYPSLSLLPDRFSFGSGDAFDNFSLFPAQAKFTEQLWPLLSDWAPLEKAQVAERAPSTRTGHNCMGHGGNWLPFVLLPRVQEICSSALRLIVIIYMLYLFWRNHQYHLHSFSRVRSKPQCTFLV